MHKGGGGAGKGSLRGAGAPRPLPVPQPCSATNKSIFHHPLLHLPQAVGLAALSIIHFPPQLQGMCELHGLSKNDLMQGRIRK